MNRMKDMMRWSRTDGVDGPIPKMEKYHQDGEANLIDLSQIPGKPPEHSKPPMIYKINLSTFMLFIALSYRS